MRSGRSLGLALLLAACEKLPPVPGVVEPQAFRVTSEVWSGSAVTITSPAFAGVTAATAVLLDEQPLDAYRVDDTTFVAPVPDAPGPHSLRVIDKAVVPTPVVIHLRGFVERVEGPLLSGRIEPGLDPRYVFGSGPTSLRRWNVATNKAVDLGDTVHAVSCTRGVGPGPNVGELVLLTGGCAAGSWMVWRTEPLTPLTDTTSVATTEFVAVLRTGRWVVLRDGVFSVVACNAGEACTAEPVGGFIGSDVVRSPRGDRGALLVSPSVTPPAGGVPVVDVPAGRVGYRVPALTGVQGAAFSPGGDTLFLAGDSAGVFALVAVRAIDGQRLDARPLDYTPCAVAVDTARGWLYVAGVTATPMPRRSLLQVYDRGTLSRITTLHVTSDRSYGINPCRILQNPFARRVQVVDVWAAEHNPAARAQLYSFETPR